MEIGSKEWYAAQATASRTIADQHIGKSEKYRATSWFFAIIFLISFLGHFRTDPQLSFCEESLKEANGRIEDAGRYAWTSYNDMGHTLDSLYPVDYYEINDDDPYDDGDWVTYPF